MEKHTNVRWPQSKIMVSVENLDDHYQQHWLAHCSALIQIITIQLILTSLFQSPSLPRSVHCNVIAMTRAKECDNRFEHFDVHTCGGYIVKDYRYGNVKSTKVVSRQTIRSTLKLDSARIIFCQTMHDSTVLLDTDVNRIWRMSSYRHQTN